MKQWTWVFDLHNGCRFLAFTRVKTSPIYCGDIVAINPFAWFASLQIWRQFASIENPKLSAGYISRIRCGSKNDFVNEIMQICSEKNREGARCSRSLGPVRYCTYDKLYSDKGEIIHYCLTRSYTGCKHAFRLETIPFPQKHSPRQRKSVFLYSRLIQEKLKRN